MSQTYLDHLLTSLSFPDHAGRPGKVGGSLPRKSGPKALSDMSVETFEEIVGVKRKEVGRNTFWYYMNTEKGLAGVSLNSDYSEKAIEIHWLTAEQRGAGNAALNKIIKEASNHNVKLVLWARPLPGQQNGVPFKLSKTRLERFYKDHGFKVDRRDADGYAWMVRMP